MKTSQVLRNTTIAFGINVSLKLANVLVFILISRISGVEQAGIFSLATTFLLILSTILVGLDELVTRQVARDRTKGKEYLSVYIPFRLILSVGLYILVLLVINFLDYSDITRIVIIFIGLSLFPDGISSVAQALLIAYERFGVILISSVLSGLIKIIGAFWVIKSGYGVIGVGAVWLLGSTIGAILNISAALRQSGGLHSLKHILASFNFKWLQMDVPFLAMSMLATLEYQLDVLMLSKMQGALELGLYSSITTLISGLLLIPQAFRAAVYPYMIRSFNEVPSNLERIYRISIVGLGTLALPIVVGFEILSRPILMWLFSDLFAEAGTALQVIVLVLIFLFLNVPSSRILLIYEKQGLVSLFWVISLGVNFLLNTILIPELSIVGAAISRVISEAVFFCMAYYSASRLIDFNHSFRDLLIPAIAAVLMGLVVWPFRNMALWCPILVGVIAYLLFMTVLLQVFRQDRLLFKDVWTIFMKMIQNR